MDQNHIDNITLSDIAKGWPHYKSVTLPYGSCNGNQEDTCACDYTHIRGNSERAKTPPCPPEQFPVDKAAQMVKSVCKKGQKTRTKTALVLLLWQYYNNSLALDSCDM